MSRWKRTANRCHKVASLNSSLAILRVTSLQHAITAIFHSLCLDRYSEIRSSETTDLPKVEMSYIGG